MGRRIYWSDQAKADFIDHLATTCNVKAAAALIGIDPSSAYQKRRKDAAFAAMWSEALAHGYELLETRLVGRALAGEQNADGDAALGPLDVALAIKLLAAHRSTRTPPAFKGGVQPRRATIEETDTAILKKLAAVERRLGLTS